MPLAEEEAPGAQLPLPQPAAGVEAPAAQLPLPQPASSVQAATAQLPSPQATADVEVDGVLSSLWGWAVNCRGSANSSANGRSRHANMEPLVVSLSKPDGAIAEVLEPSDTVPSAPETGPPSRPPHWSGEADSCWGGEGAVPACIPQAVLHQAIGPVLSSADWSAGVAKACHGLHTDGLVKAADISSTSKSTVSGGAIGTLATAAATESGAPLPAPMRQKPRNRPVTRGASGVPVALQSTDWLDVQSSEGTDLTLDFI